MDMTTTPSATDIVTGTGDAIDLEATGAITRDEAIAILNELDSAARDYAD